MINVTELKIFNYVWLRFYRVEPLLVVPEIPIKIMEIAVRIHTVSYDKSVIKVQDGITCTVEDLEPMEINEMIQKVLGLENHKQIETGNNFYRLYETSFYDQDGDEQYGWELSRNNEGLGIIKYVHELQNLYFFLTKQELDFKL